MRALTKLTIIVVAVLFAPTSVPAQTIEDLYGTWSGTWFIDEKYDQWGNPVGTPPYEPIPIDFLWHAWNGSIYGEVTFPSGGSIPGNAMTLAIDPSSVVTSDVYYDLAGAWSNLTGVLDDDTITGDFDDEFPALPGWWHYRGPVSVTRTPEPHSLALLLFGGLILMRRRLTMD